MSSQYYQSPEYRAKQSENMRRLWKSPAYRANATLHMHPPSTLGKKFTPEHREKIGAAQRGTLHHNWGKHQRSVIGRNGRSC